MFAFAHLSDMHLGHGREDGGVRALERAERVLRHLDALPGALDALLITGDIADHGTPEEYEQAAELLARSRYRALLCPGNHDERGPYRAGLLGGDATDGSPVNELHVLPGAVFALCDSSVPGRGEGHLDDGTLAWLDRSLGEAPQDRPAFVCFHHPPTALHVPYVDAIRQFDEGRLADVVARHPRVAALLCGHSHTPTATTFAGRPLMVAPGVVSTLRLPWEGEDDGPVDFSLPPMVAYHVLDDGGRLTTHFRVVPGAEG